MKPSEITRRLCVSVTVEAAFTGEHKNRARRAFTREELGIFLEAFALTYDDERERQERERAERRQRRSGRART